MFLSENGFSRLEDIKNDPVCGFNKLNLTEDQLKARVTFICEFFKGQLDKTSNLCLSRRSEKEED